MKLTAKELAALVQGRLSGDGNIVIEGIAGLEEATARDVSFVRDAKNAQAIKALAATTAGVVIVPEGLSANGKTLIEVKNPIASVVAVLQKIFAERKITVTSGVHPTAFVAKSAKLGRNVSVGPFCVIEDQAELGDNVSLVAQVYIGPRSKVGTDSFLYPQVVLREDVSVGQRCILHSGTVIGSDGYGFYFGEGKHNKIPQVGSVIVEDDVEMGACCAIDRAMTGRTIIGKGTKLDNLVHIAHNVEVGAHSLLAAQVGIAGSTKIGQGVVMGGQVGIADHTVIGNRVQIGAQSGVKDDTPDGAVLFGSPAQAIQDTLRQTLLIRRLPDLFKDVKNLKDKSEKS